MLAERQQSWREITKGFVPVLRTINVEAMKECDLANKDIRNGANGTTVTLGITLDGEKYVWTNRRRLSSQQPFENNGDQNDPELYDVDYIYGDILNKSVLPVIIRADYNRDPEESELHHPYSHITLGGYKNCRIPVDRPISPMKFVKFIMEHFYYVPSSQLEFNFEIEGIVAFEEHIAEKDINKSRIIV